jgi:hypothetical protein
VGGLYSCSYLKENKNRLLYERQYEYFSSLENLKEGEEEEKEETIAGRNL